MSKEQQMRGVVVNKFKEVQELADSAKRIMNEVRYKDAMHIEGSGEDNTKN